MTVSYTCFTHMSFLPNYILYSHTYTFEAYSFNRRLTCLMRIWCIDVLKEDKNWLLFVLLLQIA